MISLSQPQQIPFVTLLRLFVRPILGFLTFLTQDALNHLIDELGTAIDEGDL
jgi:hypothetical protein